MDNENKHKEMKTIKTALFQYDYKQRQIKLALRPKTPKKKPEEREEPPNKAYLPYIKGTTNKISSILKKRPSSPRTKKSAQFYQTQRQKSTWRAKEYTKSPAKTATTLILAKRIEESTSEEMNIKIPLERMKEPHP